MDKEQKKRITSNITFLKERLSYLEPLIDRLVDKGIFTIEQKEKIEKANPPTPHKRFNEFIQMLLASPDHAAFQAFIQSLEEERFFNIVEKLCKDGYLLNNNQQTTGRPSTRSNSSLVRDLSSLRPTTQQTIRREQTTINSAPPPPITDAKITQMVERVDQVAAAAASPWESSLSRHTTAAQAMQEKMTMEKMTAAIGQMFAEFSGKVTNDLLDGFERRRHEERMDIEISMERKIADEIDRRMSDKLTTFRSDWEEQKSKLIERNEKALMSLQDSVEQLRSQTDAYQHLKQKYDALQQTHGQMREKENERWQKLSLLNKENNQHKNELEIAAHEIRTLRDRVDELESENRAFRDNEIQDQHRIEQLTAEKEDLLSEMERMEREKMDLQMRVDALSREIERLINQQQERADREDKAYQEALRRQNERLDELYKVVQALTERERQSKTLFIGGNAVQKSARMGRPKN